MWYVYFLELSNNDIYIGYTSNLKQRFKAHNNGDVTATKELLPAKLKAYIAVDNQSTAIKLEKYFKSGSGRAFAHKHLWCFL